MLNFICRMLSVSEQLVRVILVLLGYQRFLEQFLHQRISILQQKGLGPATHLLPPKGFGSLLVGSFAWLVALDSKLVMSLFSHIKNH